MYQFTNGIIVYDEKTKDKFLKSGFKLKKMKKEKQKICKVQEKRCKLQDK